MKITRTVSIKVTEGHPAFQKTLEAFCAALNFAGEHARTTGTWSNLALQKALYTDIRERFGLKAQMTCSVFRQVAAAYKHDNKGKQARKREKGVRFRPTSVMLQHARDWSLGKDGRLSINSLEGRLKLAFRCGEHQRQYLDGSWRFGAATLIARKGKYFLNISVSKEAEEAPEPDQIVGVDVGQNYLAVASNLEDEAVFFGGGEVKNRNRHYRRLRKRLQAKGTRGAKRLLRHISGKQRRFQADVNHCVSKKVVAFAARSGKSLIAVEDLTGIRDQVKRGQRRNQELHGWSFYQLRHFLEYKANAKGMAVMAVDPRNTSKGCSRCGHVAEGQRLRHSFSCRGCGLRLHSDLNASRNIAQRARSVRQGLMEPGTPSWCPEGSPVEAKAPTGNRG